MKSVTVLRAASFRTLGARLFDPVILPELIDSAKARYNFRQAPSIEALSQKPASFEYGEVRRGPESITIEQLLVSYVGVAATSIAASTRTSTDDSDFFLDELLTWASKKYSLDVKERFAHAYNSLLEVVFEGPITRRFADLSSVGREVTSHVRSYGLGDCPDYEPEGFSMHFELNPALWPSPIAFSVQRRNGARYSENKYFSSAPLKTKDHQKVLGKLEKIFLTA